MIIFVFTLVGLLGGAAGWQLRAYADCRRWLRQQQAIEVAAELRNRNHLAVIRHYRN